MEENKPHYPIALIIKNGAAARVTYEALELYSRIGTGQLHVVTEMARSGLLKNRDGAEPSLDDLRAFADLLKSAKGILFGYPEGGSHGIHGRQVSPEFQVAWEAVKHLRHRVAWDNNPGSPLGVYHQDPGTSKDFEIASTVPDSVLDALPDGMFIGKQGGEWIVVEPETRAGGEIANVARARSASALTAVAKAAATKNATGAESF